MANTMLDLRRTDLRGTTLENPYWVTSAPITKDADDTEAVLFDFPLTGGNTNTRGLTIIHCICCEIVTPFAGGTITLDIGLGTIPLITTTTGGTVTITDADEYIINTEITHGTAGVYFPQASDFVTALAAGTHGSPVVLVHLDAAIPVIYATLVSDAAITAGVARVHALFNRVPLMG
jgi:hypothetical protein